MANILKQIKVGNTTYNIEPVTAYLPLSGGTIDAGGSKAPLILKGGASNWNEGLRIVPAGNWSTIMLGGNDIAETEGTSANSWSIHNNNGKFYISKNGSDYASTKLSNTDGTWRVNDNTIIDSNNIGSQSVSYASSSHLLRTYNSGDGSHGADYYLKCKHNVDGDGRFKLQIIRNDGSVTHSTSVDYAKLAGSAGSVSWGNIGGKPSTFPPESHTHSEFSSVVGFDHDKYTYGEKGSWRLQEYQNTGNSLDIRYGKININAQEKTYSVSFGPNQSFTKNDYTIVFGIYRSNRNSWFWSPLVTERTNTGFKVYVRGNTSGDNSGTLFYIAIRSN